MANERDEQSHKSMQGRRDQGDMNHYGGSGGLIGSLGYADHRHSSGATQSSLGNSHRFDQHGGQSGNQWQGHNAGGFDQQRYGQQGLGSWGGGHHDDHEYRNWRDQQMQRFDREYQEFRKHRQERFGAEFEEWRRSRGGQGSSAASQGPDEQVSTTQRSSVPIDSNISNKGGDTK